MSELNKTVQQPFKVICINDSNLDEKIEQSELIKFGEEYIVTNIYTDLISGKNSFVLMDKNPAPYKGFIATRFTVLVGSYISYLTGIN